MADQLIVTDTTTLYSSADVVEHVGRDLTFSALQRWMRSGAVTPARPATGTGSRAGWSHHDLLAVDAIARVRSDLAALGLPCPWSLVGQLWEQLTDGNHVQAGRLPCRLATDTVEITVRLSAQG